MRKLVKVPEILGTGHDRLQGYTIKFTNYPCLVTFLSSLFSPHPKFRWDYLCRMSFCTCHCPSCCCARLLRPRCPWRTGAPTGRESWEKKWTQSNAVLLILCHLCTILLYLCMTELSYNSICTWHSSVWECTEHRMCGCGLLPAEDLGERQNLSVTVPHRHSWSFPAAQTTQEGGRSFLLVCHFPSRAPLCQVLLRSNPAYSLDVASLFIHPTGHPSDLLISFLLFGERETDGLHAVDLHKRQVKLRKAGERLGQAAFKCAGPALF